MKNNYDYKKIFLYLIDEKLKDFENFNFLNNEEKEEFLQIHIEAKKHLEISLFPNENELIGYADYLSKYSNQIKTIKN